jgi:hypothetical protein
MSWNSRSRLNFAHALNKFTHTHIHIHTKVVTLSFPHSGRSAWPVELLSEAPGVDQTPLLSSGTGPDWRPVELLSEVPGVDQAPLLSSGTGPDLRLISPGVVLTESRRDCQMSLSTFPWSPSWVKTAQRVGAPGWRRTRNTIGWHATSFSPVSLPIPMQPSRQLVVQGASWLESHWGLHLCGNIVRGETKQYSEEWRTQILILL